MILIRFVWERISSLPELQVLPSREDGGWALRLTAGEGVANQSRPRSGLSPRWPELCFFNEKWYDLLIISIKNVIFNMNSNRGIQNPVSSPIMYKDVYYDVCSLGHPVGLISVLSKLTFLVMYWPGMAGRYTKNGCSAINCR